QQFQREAIQAHIRAMATEQPEQSYPAQGVELQTGKKSSQEDAETGNHEADTRACLELVE
ncbi:MAG: hypothetical protein JSS49_30600, partial [Planctomycetes bacterium]|nr:hypothetical protein [Planctomycetota bacterium]